MESERGAIEIDDRVKRRAHDLIREGERLIKLLHDLDDHHHQWRMAAFETTGWTVSTLHLLKVIFPSETGAHAANALAIASKEEVSVEVRTGRLLSLLKSTMEDLDAGVLFSVADSARGDVFANLLDHADILLGARRVDVAGVIAGVAFEDCIRRACEKHEIPQKDVELEQPIVALTKKGLMNGVKAQRSRGAAALRTKATHAQWEEFGMTDVESTISLTRELVDRLLLS